MKTISNTDYHTARQLLRHLSTTTGKTLPERRAADQAKLLLRKWERKDNTKK